MTCSTCGIPAQSAYCIARGVTSCSSCHDDHVDNSPRPDYPDGHSQTLCNWCWLEHVKAENRCAGCGGYGGEAAKVLGIGWTCRCARNHGPLWRTR